MYAKWIQYTQGNPMFTAANSAVAAANSLFTSMSVSIVIFRPSCSIWTNTQAPSESEFSHFYDVVSLPLSFEEVC